jgi:hypothetical protein
MIEVKFAHLEVSNGGVCSPAQKAIEHTFRTVELA